MDENVQFETYSNYILHKFDPVEDAPPSTIPPIPECMPAGRQSLLCLNARRPTFSLGRWAVAVGSNPDNTCMDPFHFKIFPGIEDQIMRPLGTCMHHKLNLDKGTGTGDCGTSWVGALASMSWRKPSSSFYNRNFNLMNILGIDNHGDVLQKDGIDNHGDVLQKDNLNLKFHGPWWVSRGLILPHRSHLVGPAAGQSHH